MIRFASLGSGSAGNALLVESGATRLLVDCGFSLAETEARFARLERTPEGLAGILVTHEHGDHVGGVFRLARRYGLSVWATHGTLAACKRQADGIDCRAFDSHSRFAIGGIEIEPFPVPHDAREPAQFVFSDGMRRLGILTDVGEITPHISRTLSACDALVLECNHDAGMLARSRYHAALKRRISGRLGHLDNEAAAALLRQVVSDDLQHVVAAHLSRENNCPTIVGDLLAGIVGRERLTIADQAFGFDWRQLD